MQTGKGFFATLFDVSFNGEYLASKLVRGAYRIIIAITSMTVMAWWLVAWGLPDWFGWGTKLLIVVLAPTAGIVFLVMTRLVLEFITVAFSINDKLGILIQHSHENRSNSRS